MQPLILAEQTHLGVADFLETTFLQPLRVPTHIVLVITACVEFDKCGLY